MMMQRRIQSNKSDLGQFLSMALSWMGTVVLAIVCASSARAVPITARVVPMPARVPIARAVTAGSRPLLAKERLCTSAPCSAAIELDETAMGPRYLVRAAMFSCLLRGGSDLAANMMMKGDADFSHVAAMGTVGLVFSGLVGASWLASLEQRLGSGTNHKDIVSKAAADYILYAPVANSVYLFLVPLLSAVFAHHAQVDLGALALHSANTWKEGFGSAMQLEAELFVPYNLVAFRLVPPALRPQTQACMCAAFTFGMSGLCS